MKPHVIGVDPGANGGWCRWGEDGYIDSGIWRSGESNTEHEFGNMLSVFRSLRPSLWLAVGLEKITPGHRNKGVAMMALENRGRIQGWLEALTSAPVWEPRPSTWRRMTHGRMKAVGAVEVREYDFEHARASTGRTLVGPRGGVRWDEASACCIAEATWHWFVKTQR